MGDTVPMFAQRELYIAFDGARVVGWWDHEPPMPPPKGKKWPKVPRPDIWLAHTGNLRDALIRLEEAKILPTGKYSYHFVDSQLADKGFSEALKAKRKTRAKPTDPEGGLFEAEFVGKIEHLPWGPR